ncbi:7774_t:CDS:2 [Paraglomus brasilianum]|uniref:7774_t:CDS:1 n=1 Tax=Paraglomus brasilianum TaxID=144538 RepID=A0A9N9BGD4_9GLOM|nr:7774_t:CDS:2 [Paraglomus brasilianum]
MRLPHSRAEVRQTNKKTDRVYRGGQKILKDWVLLKAQEGRGVIYRELEEKYPSLLPLLAGPRDKEAQTTADMNISTTTSSVPSAPKPSTLPAHTLTPSSTTSPTITDSPIEVGSRRNRHHS